MFGVPMSGAVESDVFPAEVARDDLEKPSKGPESLLLSPPIHGPFSSLPASSTKEGPQRVDPPEFSAPPPKGSTGTKQTKDTKEGVPGAVRSPRKIRRGPRRPPARAAGAMLREDGDHLGTRRR